jgi:hypothetical protein
MYPGPSRDYIKRFASRARPPVGHGRGSVFDKLQFGNEVFIERRGSAVILLPKGHTISTLEIPRNLGEEIVPDVDIA